MSSSSLLWDCDTIARKQVPTVQDALICCDEGTLLAVIERLYASDMPGWSCATPQQRLVARKRMRSSLRTMKECPIHRKEGKQLGVFPVERFVVVAQGHSCLIERRIQAMLVSLEGRQGNPGGDSFGGSLSCLQWNRALASRIWLEGPWDCQERYMVLASVYWQLTHRGFGCARSQHRKPSGSLLATSGKADCRDTAASVSEEVSQRAAAMGLLVADALEETYRQRMIERVETLNVAAEADLDVRVCRFRDRLQVA